MGHQAQNIGCILLNNGSTDVKWVRWATPKVVHGIGLDPQFEVHVKRAEQTGTYLDGRLMVDGWLPGGLRIGEAIRFGSPRRASQLDDHLVIECETTDGRLWPPTIVEVENPDLVV